MIYLLIPLLIMILYWAYVSMKRDIASPPVMFVAPFVVACIFACAYSDKWSLNLHFNTFMVLLFGCFEFVLACNLVHFSIGTGLRKKINDKENISYKMGVITPRLRQVFFIIAIQCLSLYIVINNMRSLLGAYGISGNLTTLMYYYREYHMFTDKYDVTLSSLASNIRIFSIAISYIWIYIISNNWICKCKKNIIPMSISVILGVGNGIILGARGEALQLIVAFAVIYFFLRRKYNGWKTDIKLRQLFLMGLIVFILAISFKSFGSLLGRDSVVKYSVSAIDELAKYFGAEIKNLDIYLEEPFNYGADSIPGSQTFGNILSWIGAKLNFNWDISKELPFQKVNGISLGNVYTVFYAYIYDFGYFGMIVLNLLMAVGSQLFYEYSIVEKKNEVVSFRIIVCSYVLFLTVFSFFGERFFSYVLNISFIKYLIIWKIMIWLMTKLKFKFVLRRS